MTTVTVKSTLTAHAIAWAAENFGIDSFKLETYWPDNFNKFIFKDPKQATHFALKWM